MFKRQRTPRAPRPQFIESLEARTLLASTYPIATLATPTPPTLGGTFTFKVTYTSTVRVATSSIDNSDIIISGPNGYFRSARFVSIVSDNVKTVTARYKVSTPGGLWDAPDNGLYMVKTRPGQVRDALGRYVPAKKIGTFNTTIPSFPTDSSSDVRGPRASIDVGRWGATPDDGIDDSAAIQAAIDSLDRSNGVTNGNTWLGGMVWLREGTYDISSPLLLSSGVTIRGAGPNTVLRSTSNDPSSSVILLHSYFGHGYVMRAGVQDLTITSNKTAGILSRPANGDVINLRLTGLTISTMGTAIDLHDSNVYQAQFRNITVTNPGSSALWLELHQGHNTAFNRIENFVVNGTARSGFNAPTAMVSIGGDMQINGMSIGDLGKPVLPLLIKDTVTMRKIALLSSPANLPGGVLASFDGGRVELDAIANLASNRKLLLTKCRDAHVGAMTVAAGSTLAQSVIVSDIGSHITIDSVNAPSGVGAIDKLRTSVKQTSSTLQLSSPLVTMANDPGPSSSLLVDVRSFGAIPDDNQDDTSAIQAAIDSLPRGNTLPGSGMGVVGGTVLFPAGKFNIAAPLRLPSGVWLQGAGAGTLIHSEAAASDSTIQLVAGAVPGYNVGAGIIDLTIFTTAAGGVFADPSLYNGVFDLLISNLQVGAGGIGVDLHRVKTYHSIIQDLIVKSPGSAALWLGDGPGYSADNIVVGLQVSGENRPGYRAERAQVMISGQTVIESVGMQPSNDVLVLPLLLSGVITMRGLWQEYTPASLPNGVTVAFENVTYANIDRLLLIDDEHKLSFRNAKNVSIGYLDITGRLQPLADSLDLDASSRITIGTVASIYDAGSLDAPQLTILGNYSRILDQYTDTSLAKQGTNIASNVSNWTVGWGDQFGAVQGLLTQEPVSGAMSIQIISNPALRYVTIHIPLTVQPNMVGKLGVAMWRVDGPGQPLVWTTNYGVNMSGRVTNSATAALYTQPLQLLNQELIIMLPPVSSGYFTISNVRVVSGA